MCTPIPPLTEQELNRLDKVLAERLDAGLMREGVDFGLCTVCDLDGFLTAVASGPDIIAPSAWLRAVWGEQEPHWRSAEECQSTAALMTRHMRWMDSTLATDPASFEPLFAAQLVGGAPRVFVDWWCYGYMVGVHLNPQAWDLSHPTVNELLTPIAAFCSKAGYDALSRLDAAAINRTRGAIPQSVRKVYAYWRAERVGRLRSESIASGE